MRILVYLPTLNKTGGSIRTTLAFMDTFKQLGVDVKLWTTTDKKFKYFSSVERQIDQFGLKYITTDDILLDDRRPDANLVFCRGCHNSMFEQADVKSIIWIISDFDNVKASNIQQRWVNSETTAQKHNIKNYHVIYPPHDYSVFRQYSRPFEDRDIDFVTIGRMNAWKEKGMNVFESITKTMNLNSVMISSANTKEDYIHLGGIATPVAPNQSREAVAKILGRSKFFLFPSRNESSPLSIYEALNAGCIPISRDVGAVREQLGDLGYIFNHDHEISDLINKITSKTHDISKYMDRGYQFDREYTLHRIRELLNI